VRDDENSQQSAEEILLSVADRLEDDQLPHFTLRLALTTHTGIPDENAIDHLAEAEKVFAPQKPKKASAKKTPKKAARKPTPARAKRTRRKPPSASQPDSEKGPAMAPGSAQEDIMIQFTFS
jgi:hypothetical protein